MIQIKNDSPVNLSSFTIKVQFSNGSNITSVANNNGGNSVLHGDSYEINPINRAKNVMIYARSSSGINLDAVTIVSNGETYTCELDR
jgi:hypothetical protein